MHTACVWSEKNYRLQDIQLSKFFCARLRSRWLTHSRGPKAPLRSFAVVASPPCGLAWQPLEDIELPADFLSLPGRSPRRRGSFSQRRLVENTGLEPVTSWLQTRRSPS